MNAIKRGDVFYIEQYLSVGHEQRTGRPAIIVSNDKCNEYSPVVEVVYLTTSPKQSMPTHVVIKSTYKVSTALCEQVSSISIERLGDRLAHLTVDEMKRIDQALCLSLGIEILPESTQTSLQTLEIKLLQAEKERDIYKGLFEHLLESSVAE